MFLITIACLKYFHISIKIQLDWYTGGNYYTHITAHWRVSIFVVNVCGEYSICFRQASNSQIGNFTPPIPKKMSRVIFFFRQSFRNCYSLDCTMNNSQIHKIILILSYTSKRPVLLWQLCMQATWNSIFCDSTGPGW